MSNNTLKAFLLRLERYPAFAALLAVIFLLGGARYWCFFLALPVYFYLLNPILRKTCLIVCVFIGCSYILHGVFSKDLPQNAALENRGSGFVLQTLNRAEGYAIILRTEAGKTRLNCRKKPPLPGDSIDYSAKWFANMPQTVPNTFDVAGWMRSQDLVASGNLESAHIVSSKFTFQRFSFNVKAWLEKRFNRFYEKPEASLLMGLLAGDRSGIAEELQSDFRKTGLVHVLSISGFHVVMLAGMLVLFLKMFGLPLRAVRIVAIALLCIYAPITGGSAAVWRAVLMFAVMECATLFQKSASSINALGAALILILLYDPSQIFDVGFQLSAAATLGILLGQKVKLPQMRGSVFKGAAYFVIESSWVTLCATLGTLPLLVFYFQTFSPVSWIGNLIVVPLIGLGMQAGVLSLALAEPTLCGIFADGATLLLRAGSWVTTALADNPYAAATVGAWSLPVALAAGLVVGMLPFCAEQNPWGRRIAIASLALCFVVFCVNEVYDYIKPSWSAVFMDVGQGDLTVLKTPAGRYYMIDAGPPLKKRSMARDRIVPYLRGQGVSHLEGLIITHPDLDHYGNAQELMQEFPVKELWTSACARGYPKESWQRALKAAQSRNVVIRDLHKGLQVREKMFGVKKEWSMTVLYPDSLFCSKHTNANSLVLRVEGIGGVLLLQGDLEKEGERELLPYEIRSDVLKLGHHGSKTSSTRSFLERVSPQYGVIMAGEKNLYKHPDKGVLERLDSLGIISVGTYKDGSIRVVFDEKGYTVSGYKDKWVNLSSPSFNTERGQATFMRMNPLPPKPNDVPGLSHNRDLFVIMLSNLKSESPKAEQSSHAR